MPPSVTNASLTIDHQFPGERFDNTVRSLNRQVISFGAVRQSLLATYRVFS